LSAIYFIPGVPEIIAVSIHQLFVIVDDKYSVYHAAIQARRAPKL
jgi:hypothetical protein